MAMGVKSGAFLESTSLGGVTNLSSTESSVSISSLESLVVLSLPSSRGLGGALERD